MFQSHKQVGKTRVNKVREGVKNKKTHVQFKKNKDTGLDKLFKLQESLFKEGLDANEYNDYIVDKINNKNYYYNGLTDDNIEKLKERYGNMIEKENNKYIVIGKIKSINRKRRSDFKNKKRDLIVAKKTEIIDSILKEMKKSNSIGVTRNTDSLSRDPGKWNHTKKFLFTGGRYIESHDINWVNLYEKYCSNFSPYLFDLHSTHSLNQYIFDA